MSPIFTVGHGGRTAEGLICLLEQLQIQYLVDVRSAPYSRHQPDFCRKVLEAALVGRGPRYAFMGDLLGGRPRDPDCYTHGHVDYARCRTKDLFRRGLDRLKSAHDQGFRVCLLCGESKPWECHRSRLVGAVLHEEGIEVEHILPDDSLCSQEDVMLQVTGGQGELFVAPSIVMSEPGA